VRNAWRIVVADDYADAADTLAFALGTYGCTPYTARDGPTALAQIREHKPHAALLELALPGVAGWDVAPAVRGDPCTTRTVMITVTAWGRNCDRLQAKRCGFAAYVLKPANVSDLLRLIDSALEQRAQPATLMPTGGKRLLQANKLALAIWRRLDGSRVWSATPPHRAATLWRTHAH